MVRPPTLAFALIRVVDAANSVVEFKSKVPPDVCASLAHENMIAVSWNESGRQSQSQEQGEQGMTQGEKVVAGSPNYYDVEQNGGLVLKLFTAYYRTNNHSGKIYDESPHFFLVKPPVLESHDISPPRSDH